MSICEEMFIAVDLSLINFFSVCSKEETIHFGQRKAFVYGTNYRVLFPIIGAFSFCVMA